MFEDGSLSMDELKTDRDSTTNMDSQINTSLNVPSSGSKKQAQDPYQPSPVKPQNLRKQLQSRNSIRQILSQFSMKTIDDIVRIKKPQKSSHLIGQLFCMLIWVYRESAGFERNAAASSQLASKATSVPFQNLEDEFSAWENVQNYLSHNTVSIYSDV